MRWPTDLSIICTCAYLQQQRVRPHKAQPTRTLPNIVFIIADDLGYGDLGCYGQKKIRTPNIDRLADEGMRFTTHFTPAATCAQPRRDAC